eukprot:1126593-Rhodomonas_salina.1
MSQYALAGVIEQGGGGLGFIEVEEAYEVSLICLRICYALPGTDLLYAPTHEPVLTLRMCYAVPGTGIWPISLCICYALSGTDMGYAWCGQWYKRSARAGNPWAMTRLGSLAEAKCVRDRPRDVVQPGELRYLPTRALRYVRY